MEKNVLSENGLCGTVLTMSFLLITIYSLLAQFCVTFLRVYSCMLQFTSK